MPTRLIFFILAILFYIPSIQAQSSISFAVLGGVNIQNLNGKNATGSKLENDLIVGYHAGVNVQIPIAPTFYFQPGLLYTTKGAKNTSGEISSTYHLAYVEMPLNFVFKAPLGSGFFMLGFGPYLGYGIGGKVNTEGGAISLKTDVTFQNTVEISDPITATYFRPLDAGGNILVGYEGSGGLFFQLNAQLGMLEINPEDKRIPNDQSNVKNTGFGASLGFRF